MPNLELKTKYLFGRIEALYTLDLGSTFLPVVIVSHLLGLRMSVTLQSTHKHTRQLILESINHSVYVT